MSTTHPAGTPTVRIEGPADLLDAVPYLLGFHPADSLVLLGLDASRLVVTVRIDLADLALRTALSDSMAAMCRGGATLLVAAVYDDGGLDLTGFTDLIAATAAELDCEVADVLRVVGNRWWSLTCTDPCCCPAAGRLLPTGTSQLSAEATYAGMSVLPDRDALAATLSPEPDRERLRPLLDAAAAAADAHDADLVVDAVRATARSSGRPHWRGVSDEKAIRFGLALRVTAIRDEIWTAVDRQEIDGAELWRELARRLPAPYDAAPAFLVGWQAWRAGNGALANVASDRALESDPGYSAAELLIMAVSAGLDPRRMPPLDLGPDEPEG